MNKNNQWIFLGWTGSLHGTTDRYCEQSGSQDSNCTRKSINIFRSKEYCFCNEDLCNSGNWDRELSYLVMAITIGFQIVINCLVA